MRAQDFPQRARLLQPENIKNLLAALPPCQASELYGSGTQHEAQNSALDVEKFQDALDRLVNHSVTLSIQGFSGGGGE